jgi:hypothetical protein
MTGLYTDPTTGLDITTHSMVKTFRTCPKQADYKYAQRLKPKRQAGALKRGVWMHELLELKHSGRDWRARHAQLASKFNEMFDEEREFYGDLPNTIRKMMEAYEWHYAKDDWVVHETEVTLEAEMPDGRIGRGKVDAIVETHDGLYIGDHKTHGRIPSLTFRLLDAQNAFYIWLAWKMGIPVKGFIWNYVKWKLPSVPELVYKDTKNPRLSRSKGSGDTDFPTYTAALKEYKAQYPHFKITAEYVERQRYLRSIRYNPQNPVLTSPFFERRTLPGDLAMVKQVVRELLVTSTRMHDYSFATDHVERMPGRACDWCDYKYLCQTELMGGDSTLIRRNMFKLGDPQEYYQDRPDDQPGMAE